MYEVKSDLPNLVTYDEVSDNELEITFESENSEHIGMTAEVVVLARTPTSYCEHKSFTVALVS